MNKLEIAESVLRYIIKDGSCGIFDQPDCAGDTKRVIYDADGLKILICDDWKYFEVYGLPKTDFDKLKTWYDSKVQHLFKTCVKW